MANLPDGSGDAYSNLVQGDGGASLTFTMPGTVPLAVGSVVATVDNSAGGSTKATLVIRDPSGEVIATKRQGEAVDAGATTTATWALRLDDEGQATAGDGLQYDVDNEGDWFYGAANLFGGGPNGYSWQFDTGSSNAPVGITNDGGFVVDSPGDITLGGGGTVTLDNLTVTPGAALVDALTASALVTAQAGIDNGGHRITNGADGIDPTDFATVEQLSSAGVSSLAKSGDTPLTGDVTLSEGANVTLTQSGQDIEIAATVPPAGIDFDTANSGDWLDITATGTDGGGLGLYVNAEVGGILLHSADEAQLDGDFSAKVESGATLLYVSPGFVQAILEPGGVFQVLGAGNNPVLNVTEAGEVGFFNVGPVAQQATPVTLGDVIALLQAYGLAA